MRIALKEGREKDDEKINWQKHTRRRCKRTTEATNEIANKCNGDHNRPRRDHRNGNRIQKLPLRQPAILSHHSAAQECDDRESTAKNNEARLQKIPKDRKQ